MGGRDNEGVWDGHAHTAVFKTGSPTRTYCMAQCGSLHGRRVWGSTDTCVCVAESLRHAPETITALFVNRPCPNTK